MSVKIVDTVNVYDSEYLARLSDGEQMLLEQVVPSVIKSDAM